MKPDVVVLAEGGKACIPEIPGINNKNVIKSSDLYGLLKFYLRFLGPKLLRSLTRIWMPVGNRVVIIGGAIQGCQLAEFLVKRGRSVTIVDEGKEPGEGLAPERKTRLFAWFRKKGVKMILGVKLEEITDRGLVIISADGKKQLLEADNIIPALPFIAGDALLKELEGSVPEIYAIGDCINPAIIPDAIAGGWKIGNKL